MECKLTVLRCFLFYRHYQDGGGYRRLDPRYDLSLTKLRTVSENASRVEKLSISNINFKTIENFENAWKLCLASRSKLKSLYLCKSINFADEYGEEALRIIDEGFYSRLQEIQQLNCLESLYFEGFEDLKKLIEAVRPHNGKSFRIKTLGLKYCDRPLLLSGGFGKMDPGIEITSLTRSLVERMNDLTELDVRAGGTGFHLEDLLSHLPRGLSSLYWARIRYTFTDPYPNKKVLGKHFFTLRRLWLEIKGDREPVGITVWPDNSPCEIFTSAPASGDGDGILTLETLSQLPLLEHLAVPIDKSISWDRLSPMVGQAVDTCLKLLVGGLEI
ncbi:hypothetical protein TWF730_003137 [Orbilia blumenaviensis]|uniref:Uncharacterized protein n=1 Tax=Orbilia blumenaviensis TaxID=1796055 RepID=A0AAV9U4K7_9PEZI